MAQPKVTTVKKLPPHPEGFLRHEAQDAIEEWAKSQERTKSLWRDVLDCLDAIQADKTVVE